MRWSVLAASVMLLALTAAALTVALDARSRDTLLDALIVTCVVVAAVVAGGTAMVWFSLLRPLRALRAAMDSVTDGDYGTQIPAAGPAELADLGRGIELMRTRLVKTLAARERAEERFRGLFDGAPDPMIAVAPDGSITMANERAMRMFGYPAGELVGQPVESLVPELWRDLLTGQGGAYVADPRSRAADEEFTVTGLRRDGSEFPAEVTLTGLPAARGMLVTAAIRDVSERVAVEAERERRRAAAQQERSERRMWQFRRLESLGQLAGGVAHDFSNLLNVIQGYTDFAAEQVTALAPEETRLVPVLADIGRVQAAAQQAIRVTRQLQTFARHQATTPEIIDLNEAVQSAGELLRRTLGEHIELSMAPAPGLWRVKAGRGQLEQVLVNLAVNARDAMPRGGRLTIDTGNTEVDEAFASQRPGLSSGRYVRLRVSDTGTGMDQATLDRVFEPFFSTKPAGRGTGLGLATVYGIVTGAGGSIDIYSQAGLGTTVSMLLPATAERAGPDAVPPLPAPPVPAPVPAPVPPAGDEVGGHGKTILLVQDEPILRELTSRILSRNGYQVCVAADGTDAVRRVQDPAQPLDLLLTDLVMPEILGHELAARLAAVRPQAPTLFISGHAQPILDSRCVRLPDRDILDKPFTEAALLNRVRKALARTPASTQPDLGRHRVKLADGRRPGRYAVGPAELLLPRSVRC